MLDKIKNVAEWWTNTAAISKVNLLLLSMLIIACYINYRDGNHYASSVEDCRQSYRQLFVKFDELSSRYHNYRMRTDQQIQKMQEDFNNRQIEENKRREQEYRELFETVDKIYHEKIMQR